MTEEKDAVSFIDSFDEEYILLWVVLFVEQILMKCWIENYPSLCGIMLSIVYSCSNMLMEIIHKQNTTPSEMTRVFKNLIILFLRLLSDKDEQLSLAVNRSMQVTSHPLSDSSSGVESEIRDYQNRIHDLVEANHGLVSFYNSLLASLGNAPVAENPPNSAQEQQDAGDDENKQLRQEIASLRLSLQTTTEDVELLKSSNRILLSFI